MEIGLLFGALFVVITLNAATNEIPECIHYKSHHHRSWQRPQECIAATIVSLLICSACSSPGLPATGHRNHTKWNWKKKNVNNKCILWIPIVVGCFAVAFVRFSYAHRFYHQMELNRLIIQRNFNFAAKKKRKILNGKLFDFMFSTSRGLTPALSPRRY